MADINPHLFDQMTWPLAQDFLVVHKKVAVDAEYPLGWKTEKIDLSKFITSNQTRYIQSPLLVDQANGFGPLDVSAVASFQTYRFALIQVNVTGATSGASILFPGPNGTGLAKALPGDRLMIIPMAPGYSVATQNLTLQNNGARLGGYLGDITVDTDNSAQEWEYINDTIGWVIKASWLHVIDAP